ncbi:MAG: D-alanine--D-alanine ligase [Acidobacteria bacterium]|nr:D-alanine--D-alanine ligase [Acidobacteriota bacterium]
MVKRLRIGVVYGGRSGEHEVSLASAAAVMANLDRARYDPVAIRIEKDGRWSLPERPPTAASAAEVIEQSRSDHARHLRASREVYPIARPGEDTLLAIDRTPARGDADADLADTAIVRGLGLDLVFPVLHGPYGEDGTVQGLFELANLPYVGAGVLASAVGMDKAVMKVVFAARGLRVAPWMLVMRREWIADPADVVARVIDTLGLPVFVKPSNLGSSVGISKAKDVNGLREAIALAAEYDRKIVVEAAVPHAREIEVAVLGNDDVEASVAGEIIPSREFYDYEAKYIDAGSKLLIPAPLAPAAMDEVRQHAIDAFRAVDGAGLARVDFLLDGQSGEVFVNEVNTMPGFTTISMYAKLWAASGLDYPTLLDRLVALALERHHEKQSLRTSV